MLDSATGLYYFNARFYDPSIMRFTTKDPLGGSQSTPLSLNSYAYALDNPLTNIDPSGMSNCVAGSACSGSTGQIGSTLSTTLG